MQSNAHSLCKSLHSSISSIAKCHILCFPDSLSGKLGLAYVKKTFEWFLVDDKRFLFHIELKGEVIGYCGGFVSKGIGDGSSSGMLQHAFKEAVIGILKRPWLAFNSEVRAVYPFVFKNIKRKFSFKKNNLFVQPEGGSNKLSGLVVIGVHPQHRGTGVYNELMQHFFEESKRLGAFGSKLSVKKDNARGIGAYKKLGWEIDEQHSKTFVLKKIF